MMEWKDIRKGAKVPAEKDSVKNVEKDAAEESEAKPEGPNRITA